jgi:hypothetical protein
MGPASPNYALPAPELRPITTQVFNEKLGGMGRVALPGMYMSNRSAKFVSAIFASILAGTSFAAVAENAAKDDGAKETSAKTADTCLSAPKGPLPAGGHWYYRLDRATKRNCWYIGEEKNKSARATPKDSAASSDASSPDAAAPASPVAANPASPQQTINVRKSIADARAELTAPQARVEDLSEPQATGAVPVAGIMNSQRAIAPDATASPSPVASRWPESSGVSPSGGPRLAAAEPPSLQTQSQQNNAAPAPQPAGTPVALAAADSSDKQSASMQMLLLTMAGALALAGITASLVFRFGRARPVQPEFRNDRRAIWDSVPAELRSPSMLPAEDTPIWRRDPPRNPPRNPPLKLARDPRAPDDPERRVTEMLARLARSAQT